MASSHASGRADEDRVVLAIRRRLRHAQCDLGGDTVAARHGIVDVVLGDRDVPQNAKPSALTRRSTKETVYPDGMFEAT
jgi:hypothetical protein